MVRKTGNMTSKPGISADTIAAIATAMGESGIGIVRLSGREALSIADKIFYSKGSGRPSQFKSYTLRYGWIKDGSRLIDEVILSVMRQPRSYTREDVVEINCHGGLAAVKAVLELVLARGARLAEPGEFTKRAFLNGRIDLAQAEAVLDIIRAKSEAALDIGLRQLRGSLSREVSGLRESLMDILSALEADIDFPEEGIEALRSGQLEEGLKRISRRLCAIIEDHRKTRIFREGVKAVICGSPNVGKSSLLNALLKQERSIVTPVAGTTRDSIEEMIDVRGIPLRVIDTAGLITPRNTVEKKSVKRARDHIASADIVLFVLDGSRRLTDADRRLMRLKKERTIPVINKIDLKQRVKPQDLKGFVNRAVCVSAKKMLNIAALEEAITGLVCQGRPLLRESATLSSIRDIEPIKKADRLIREALVSLEQGFFAELVCQDIKEAVLSLDTVTGESLTQGLLDKIFGRFCIGK